MKKYFMYMLFFLSYVSFSFLSFGSEYKKIKVKNHIIYKFVVNTKKYDFKLVKALDLPLGRESVFSMAKRYDAIAGINGGFFSVGGVKNGLPSWIFVNDKVKYISSKNNSVLKISKDGISILDYIDPKMNFDLGEQQLVSGSNVLLKNQKIRDNLDDGSYFKSKPQARTSVCKYKNGNLGFYVVDHSYGDVELRNLTISKVISEIVQLGYTKEDAMKMSSSELLSMLSNKHSNSKEKSVGMTLIELGNFLKSEKCIDAINMDGGSSSTMVYNGSVVNNPSGNTDIKEGGKFVKEVSDAILVVKKAIK